MSRSLLFLLALGICGTCVLAASDGARKNRDLGSLFDFSEPQAEVANDEPNVLGSIGDIASLIITVKNQFRSIIEDVAWQAFKYIINILHQLKIKVLKKIGLYTLADVFHLVFDGVADFVSQPVVEDEVPEESEAVNTIVQPAYSFNSPYTLQRSMYGKKK